MSLQWAIGIAVLCLAFTLRTPATASAQVTDCVSCTTYGVEVTPDGTTTASVPLNTGGFRTFTVQY